MKNLVLCLLLILSPQAFAWKLALNSALFDTTLRGEDITTGDNGRLISQGNFSYGLQLELPYSRRLKTLIGYENRRIRFDNSTGVIRSENSITTNSFSLGFRWILFSKTAVNFKVHTLEDLAFTRDNLSQAVLFKETLSYGSIELRQILYLKPRFYFGLKVGGSTLLSGDQIESRRGYDVGAFGNWTTRLGIFQLTYDYIEVEKFTANLEVKNTTTRCGLNYIMRF